MSDQIVITKNNKGIELVVQFLDNKKKPIDMDNCFVEIAFIDPNDSISDETQAYIIDYEKSICGFILEEKETNKEGLWKTYWTVYDLNRSVTAQEAIYYFVLPIYGGVV